MKTKLLAILACVMIIASLVGCSGSATPAAATNPPASVSTPESAAPAANAPEAQNTTKTALGEYSESNPYHLVFSFLEFYQQDATARAEVLDALNAYMIPNYHIEVEFLPLEFASFQSTLSLMFSGGDELDVIPIYFTDASSWIGMGGIYDMDPFMETPDGAKIVEALGQNAFVGNMNGVLYGFPANKESVEIGGLAMRADIADELGFTEKYGLGSNVDEYTGKIFDWSVATEIFEQVKQNHPNMTPLYMSSSSQMNRFLFWDTLVDGFGVLDWEADHNALTVVNLYETESYQKPIKLLADWYDKGFIYKDAANDTQGSASVMRAGNTFSYLTAIKPGFLSEANSANGFECYAMYFGNHPEGGISTTNVSFFNTGIADNSKDPEMAFKFISALYSDPVVENTWQYGIEGKNYKLLDDGTAYFVDGEDGANYKYHQNSGWCLGNQFNGYVWNDGSKTADYWQKLAKHNDWAVYSKAFGFMWDSTDYSAELTALSNALETYRAALETGTVGSANVDQTLKALNDALYASGLETVMKAKQEQLDKWLASQ
jgi:putative aldouronate transport system substrate-binding protein